MMWRVALPHVRWGIFETSVADHSLTTASECAVFGSTRIENTTNPLLRPGRHRDRLCRAIVRALLTADSNFRMLIFLDTGFATDSASQ
jgi:hypothetical protein